MKTQWQFRLDLPAFSNQEDFEDDSITFWLAVAYQMLNANRWGTMLDLAVEMFAAHNITMERMSFDQAAVGNIPGLSKGLISSQSVDKVTEAYDTAGAMEPGAGHWNLTIYGKRFYALTQMFGAGPVQVGPCGGLGFDAINGPAWPGPFGAIGFPDRDG